jgi:hypothetical protein
MVRAFAVDAPISIASAASRSSAAVRNGWTTLTAPGRGQVGSVPNGQLLLEQGVAAILPVATNILFFKENPWLGD